MKVHHGCPVRATINVLSGKWKVQAVWRLSYGALRFTEPRDLLRGVSERVLAALRSSANWKGTGLSREGKSALRRPRSPILSAPRGRP